MLKCFHISVDQQLSAGSQGSNLFAGFVLLHFQGKARVMRISTGGRMTFGDAIRYANHVLSDRVSQEPKQKRKCPQRGGTSDTRER